MIEHCTGTLVPHGRSGRTMSDDDDLADNLGTMVINTDEEEDADSTMKSKMSLDCDSFERFVRILWQFD